MEISPSTSREWLESARLPSIARRVAADHGISPGDFPDLLQELRIALWRAGMDQPINATWVFRTASHKAIDLRRANLIHPEPVELTEDLAKERLDPELLNLLRARAASLSRALREFYELRYEEGLSQRVVGKRMGLCRSSIRSLERRCLIAIGRGRGLTSNFSVGRLAQSRGRFRLSEQEVESDYHLSAWEDLTMNLRRTLVVLGLALALATPTSRAVGPLQYFTVTPCRLLDTRDPVGPHGGPALSSGSTRNFAAWGSNAPSCGIPASINVRAVTVNATIVSPTNCGHLILWQRASGSNPPPITSNINFNAGEAAIGNGAVVGLGQFSDFQFSAQVGICGGTGTAHLIVDITGYYQ